MFCVVVLAQLGKERHLGQRPEQESFVVVCFCLFVVVLFVCLVLLFWPSLVNNGILASVLGMKVLLLFAFICFFGVIVVVVVVQLGKEWHLGLYFFLLFISFFANCCKN